MSDPRKQAFAPYLRCLADKMGLRDWTVGVEDEPPDKHNLAEADCRFGRKIIWVRLSEAFLASKEESQRATCVHELLHAHTAHPNRLVYGMLDTPHEQDAYTIAMEYMVDGIAEEWAKTLPLPSQVKAKPAAKLRHKK